jgi:hypothetical protein
MLVMRGDLLPLPYRPLSSWHGATTVTGTTLPSTVTVFVLRMHCVLGLNRYRSDGITTEAEGKCHQRTEISSLKKTSSLETVNELLQT